MAILCSQLKASNIVRKLQYYCFVVNLPVSFGKFELVCLNWIISFIAAVKPSYKWQYWTKRKNYDPSLGVIQSSKFIILWKWILRAIIPHLQSIMDQSIKLQSFSNWIPPLDEINKSDEERQRKISKIHKNKTNRCFCFDCHFPTS